jgi:hypothetical protein
MSTEYTPFLGVGLTFNKYGDVIDFLNHYSLLGNIDPHKDDLGFIAQQCHVWIEYFGMDDIFFIGYTIHDGDIRTEFIPDINKALQRFENKFPAHEPELVHLVNTF